MYASLSVSGMVVISQKPKRRGGNPYVASKGADAQHRGRLFIGHLVIVMQTQHAAVLLRQVTVDDLLKLL